MRRAPRPAARWRLSASACGALGALAGLAAARELTLWRPSLAVALAGLALAAPPALRRWILPLAAGLILGWRDPALAPAARLAFDPRRAVTVVAHQVEDWQRRGGRWICWVEVEVVRQGVGVARWPRRVLWAWPGGRPPENGRWRVRGRLRRPLSPAHGVSLPPAPWSLQVKSPRLVEGLADDGAARRAAGLGRRLRGRLRRALDRAARGSPGERLVRALVLGDTAVLPGRQLRALRRSGLAHVVALSGLHLGLVAAWCALAGRRLPRRGRVALVVLGTAFYVVVGGGRASLVRAWLMVNAGAAALLGGRPARSLHALGWAAVVLAARHPTSLDDTGFRLTFAATAGVIVGLRAAARFAVGRGPWAGALASTLGAQVATLPITAAAFHWLPLWAWIWNLLLVPAVALAVPLGFVWGLAALVRPALAAAMAPALDPLAGWLALPSRWPAGILGGLAWVPGPWDLARAGLLGVSLIALHRAPRRVGALTAVLAVGLAVAIGPPRPGGAVVRFLDVGQGDAALLGEGAAGLLIDGGGWHGPGVAEKAVLPVLGRAGVRRLDVVVVTHGDRDHCRGVVELADYVPIGEVWMSPDAALSPCGRELSGRPGLRLRPLWQGGRATWRGWHFHVLSPPAGARGGGNEDSLVLRADSLGRGVLFTADVGHPTEFRLLHQAASGELAVDLLKVAHHGSAASTSRSFVAASRPRLAVVSVGAGNPFGHPSPQALGRLRRSGVAVLRTDRSGLVEVRWSGPGPWRLATPGAPGDGLQ
jgi:competence protein ComEC